MLTENFEVANVKCEGCATIIKTGLQGMSGVETIQVDVASGRVEVAGGELARDLIQAKLAELGYPVR